MYRIVFCTIFIGILFSCQKEDPIVGNWKMEKDLINRNATEAFLACSKKTMNSFTSDSVYIFDTYVMDDHDSCQALGKVTGFWRKKNDSVYLLSKGKYVDTVYLQFLDQQTRMVLKSPDGQALFELKKVSN